MVQVSDCENRVNFKRIGDYNENWRNGDNGRVESPPDWLDGTFEGYDRKYRETITVRMNRAGRLIVTNKKNGETLSRMTASYRRGLLNINNNDYRVERTDEGFLMVQTNDSANRVNFRRIGDFREP